MRFLPLALVLAAGCSKEPPITPDLATNRHLIWETVKAYHEAGDKGDVGGMKECLAPEISMFKGQEDFIKGIDEVEKELIERVKRFEGQSRNTLLGREKIYPTGDTALVTYVANVGMLRAPITAVFRKADGRWKIAHLHESWPAPAPPTPPPK